MPKLIQRQSAGPLLKTTHSNLEGMGLIRQSPHLKLKIKSLSGKTEKKNHQELLALQTHTHKAMTYLNHNNLLQN